MRKIFQNHPIKHFLVLFASAMISLELNAATIIVGPPPASIQTAINSATNGDTIQLSAGIYNEEIQVISKTLNIVGAGESLTTIRAPGASTHLSHHFTYGGANWWCVLLVDNQAAPTAQTVNISNLSIDGNNQQDTVSSPIYGYSDRFFAIGYHNSNGTVQNVHTFNTRQTANFNELTGGGIVNASDVGNVAFVVDRSTIDFYQRIGIDLRGAALTAHVTNSTINRGYVLTPNTSTATPNGIQFSGNALGSIENCTISGNIATVLNASATGILFYGAGSNLIARGNTAVDNDLGIVAISCGNNLVIDQNTVNFTTSPGVNSVEGIVVQDTNGVSTISGNTMNNLPNINMEIISSTDQYFQLRDNQFNGSQIGILATGSGTTGPIITFDSDTFTDTMGYYIQEADSPHDIWPSTSSVNFDGLYSGHMSTAQYNVVASKIYDQQDNAALGKVIDFITPESPLVTELNPSTGLGGRTITITGSGFLSSNTQVYFGSYLGSDVNVVSNTELTVTVPYGSGTVDVTVITPFGNSPAISADQFTYCTGSCL